MSSGIEKKQHRPPAHPMVKRGVLVLIFLAALLLTVSNTQARNSYAAALDDSQPTATLMRTPTATSSAGLTAVGTAALTLTSETMVTISGYEVNFRIGPGLSNPAMRKLNFGDRVELLGWYEDQTITWLFVRTASGQKGWVDSTWVDLNGANIEDHPAKSPTPNLGSSAQAQGNYINLRTGPSIYYPRIQMIENGEPLELLGRLDDDTWLFVKTSTGLEGWLDAPSVNLNGKSFSDVPLRTPAPPSQNITVKISGYTVNLRTGPGFNYSKIDQVSFGDEVDLLGRISNDTWLFVRNTGGQEGWIEAGFVNLGQYSQSFRNQPILTPPPTETATPVVLTNVDAHWIDIDLSEQRLRAYDRTNLMASFLVSTGVDDYPTETGQYRILVKRRFSDMRGPDYFLPDVPHTMFYSGDFAIHGTYWHHSFGTKMSRGCINLDPRDAEWLFNFSEVGTLVNIHR